MLKQAVRWLAVATFLVVFAGWGNAAPYVSGVLDSAFTNVGEEAWLPTEPRMFTNEMAVSKEQIKLLQRNIKCYKKSAQNYAKGKPILLSECLAVTEGKYQAKLGKILEKLPGLPACHDYPSESSLAGDFLQESVPDLLCASPDGAFVDGAVIF